MTFMMPKTVPMSGQEFMCEYMRSCLEAVYSSRCRNNTYVSGRVESAGSATRGSVCVSNSCKTFAGREHMGSPKPYLSVFFSWCTGVSSLAGRLMHSRAPSLGQAMREGQEEEVYRCRGTYACMCKTLLSSVFRSIGSFVTSAVPASLQ